MDSAGFDQFADEYEQQHAGSIRLREKRATFLLNIRLPTLRRSALLGSRDAFSTLAPE